MLTEFGKEIRKLRIDKGLRLLDLAERLNMSSAFVSAIETGRKPVSTEYVDSVAGVMALSRAEKQRLERAADQSRLQVSVGNLPGDQRELLAAFARRVDDVPQHILDELRKAVFKSDGSDLPFFRRRRGLLVPPVSTAAPPPLVTAAPVVVIGPPISGAADAIKAQLDDVATKMHATLTPNEIAQIQEAWAKGRGLPSYIDGRLIAQGRTKIQRDLTPEERRHIRSTLATRP